MEGTAKKVLKYSLFFLLAAALLFLAFRKVEWESFWSALKSCSWGYVFLSMCFGVLALWLRGLRWRQLLLPVDDATERLTCFNAVNISALVNLVLPRVGEFVRCGFITARSRKDPSCPEGENRRLASYDKVLGTAALERTADLLAMALILGIFLVCTYRRFGTFFSENIFGSAAGNISFLKIAVLAAVVLLAALSITAVVAFAGKVKFLARIKAFCKGLWQGFASCIRMKGAWRFFLLTAMIWACYWMMSASTLWAVQGITSTDPSLAATIAKVQDLNLLDALFLMLAGSLSSIVPVPGGFGAFHFIVAGAISTVYGIPFEFGIVFATISHEAQTITQILCGALSYVSESTRK